MKNKIPKISSAIAVLLIFSLFFGCNESGQSNANKTAAGEREDFAVSIENEHAILIEYMNIKDALVADEQSQTGQAANRFINRLDEDEELSQEQRDSLSQIASQIANADNIEIQREHFASLSERLYGIVSDQGLAGQTMYWQNCPMARDYQGANWLSFSEQISNPYMGQSMPRCGVTKETLN